MITLIDKKEGLRVKITEETFIKILAEELKPLIKERCFDEEGNFTKCSQGRVFSVTKNTTSKGSKRSEPKKGYYTSRSNVRSKFGMPHKCGRIDVDGKKIPVSKRRSCKDYPERYPSDIEEGSERSTDYEKICVSLGYVKKNEAFRNALIAISALEKASKGKV